MDRQLLNTVLDLAESAGKAILDIYDLPFKVDRKADESPVTEADLAAHAILQSGLEDLLEGVPVLSEESRVPDFAQRSAWRRYWIIDPLDGTKEFIKRNGEFTVNVALIEDHAPVLGVVHVPVSGVSYAGIARQGAIRKEADGRSSPIGVRSMAGRGQSGAPVAVVASRSHGSEAVEHLLKRLVFKLGLVDTCNMGSSLKLCLVAEGKADIYPRLAPTMEWDTAAAQAVVEAAGGVVLGSDLRALRYNTKEDLLNPNFYVLGDSGFPWRELLPAPQ